MDRSDPKNVSAVRVFIRSGYSIHDVETHELDRNGDSHFFLNSVKGIVEGTSLVGLIGIQREITEKRLLEMEKSKLSELLPPQEQSVFQLLCNGHSVKEVAFAMNDQPKTIYALRSSLMQRLGINDPRELVEYGIRLGISFRR